MSTPPPIPPDQPNLPPVPPSSPPVFDGPPGGTPRSAGVTGTKVLLFGCLGIVLLVVIAAGFAGKWAWGKAQEVMKDPEKFVGETIAKGHPELEFIRGDHATKTITFREKATGETLTATLEDVKGGRILLTKSDGTVVELSGGGLKAVDKAGNRTAVGGGEAAPPPAWVPVYPGGSTTVMSSRLDTDGAVRGIFVFTTPDAAASVRTTWEKILTDGGFTVRENAEVGGTGVLRADTAAEGGVRRDITVTIAPVEGQTQVTLNFNQSPPEK
ncbi:MAG: hypothetical protein V4726_16890 [Verrucomicrobiota bacterium]